MVPGEEDKVPASMDQGAPPASVQAGRLQRPPGANGYRVGTFTAIMARHGLTMGLLAVCCAFIPGAWPALVASTAPLVRDPLPYLTAALALVVFFALWSRRRPVAVGLQSRWLLYLLFISLVEEFTFRLILPGLLAQEMPLRYAAVLSNLVFASLHFVTLRWKIGNCIATFFGGMGLSYLMLRGDFALVVLVHWLFTFLNTPYPPTER